MLIRLTVTLTYSFNQRHTDSKSDLGSQHQYVCTTEQYVRVRSLTAEPFVVLVMLSCVMLRYACSDIDHSKGFLASALSSWNWYDGVEAID
jgi:hypothetical protein